MENNIKYLRMQVPSLLAQLQADATPTFGLMTPQHMIEHLIWVTKASIKDLGPAPAELNEKQLKFMKYVKSGKPMKHFPSEKTAADLPDLRMPSLEAAVSELNTAIDRLIIDAETRGDRDYYNPMMGVLSPAEMVDFHVRHYQHHLENQYQLKVVAE